MSGTFGSAAQFLLVGKIIMDPGFVFRKKPNSPSCKALLTRFNMNKSCGNETSIFRAKSHESTGHFETDDTQLITTMSTERRQDEEHHEQVQTLLHIHRLQHLQHQEEEVDENLSTPDGMETYSRHRTHSRTTVTVEESTTDCSPCVGLSTPQNLFACVLVFGLILLHDVWLVWLLSKHKTTCNATCEL